MACKRLGIPVVLLFALIGVGACKKQAAVSETPPRTEAVTVAPSPEPYHQAEGGVTAAVQAKFFKGSIGSQLGLQMKLTRNGDQIVGNYFYQKVGSKID